MSTNAAVMSKELTSDYLFEIANVLQQTFTPNGGYSLYIEGGRPQSTKDGHKALGMIVAREGSWQDYILRTLKNVTTRVALDAGDGTTSATIITAHLYKQMMFVREEMRLTIPEFNKLYNETCEKIMKYMEENLKCEVKTVEEILNISRIALNNDDTLNSYIAEAVNGYIEAGGDLSELKIALKEVDHINNISTSVTNGYTIRGNIMLNNTASSLNVKDVRIVYMEQKIETENDKQLIAAIIQKATALNCKVMIICPWIAPHIKDEFKLIFTQYTQSLGKNPPIYLVEYSPTGGMEYRYEADNTKAFLGCVPLSVMDSNVKERLESLAGMTAVDFTYDGDYIVFSDVSRELEGLYDDRVLELESMLPKKTFQEKNIVEMSLRKMRGIVATIEIGAYSPEERNRLNDAFEDAVVAISYAVKDGYIAAGNTAVLKAITGLDLKGKIADAIYLAYFGIVVTMLKMANVDSKHHPTIIDHIAYGNGIGKSMSKLSTYDVLKKEYSEDIIHSFKAEKTIFKTVTELVNNLLSCNQIILEDEFEAKAYKTSTETGML